MEFRQEFFWNLVKQPTRPLSLADGTLEVIKWLALVSMFYDHVMRIAWSGEGIGPATSFGRIAFPLFAFIMAYNLSRENVGPVVYQRTLRRLIGFGFLALPATYYFFWSKFFQYPVHFCFGYCSCVDTGALASLVGSPSFDRFVPAEPLG